MTALTGAGELVAAAAGAAARKALALAARIASARVTREIESAVFIAPLSQPTSQHE
jgi:hypothetical protein